MTFNPERFLNTKTHPAENDPHNLAFGFGRRICPGRGFADSTIFLTVVRSLQAFRIGKPVKDGREIDPAVDYLPGVISHPKLLRFLLHQGVKSMSLLFVPLR